MIMTAEIIPQNVPKRVRARLIRLQHEKAKAAMRKFFFVWDPQTMEYVTPIDKDSKKLGMTKPFSNIAKSIEVKWNIHCYVLGREKNGKNRLDGFLVKIDTPCTHDQISKQVADVHWEFIEEYRESAKSDNFITAAWIATLNENLTNEDAYTMLEKLGCFKTACYWEEKE